MSVLSHKTVQEFKSPLRTVVSFLFRSRETQKQRVHRKDTELRKAREELLEAQRHQQELRKRLDEQTSRLRIVEDELTEIRQQPVCLPYDPKLPHHSFGPKLMSMCCNLALSVGFRGAERALNIFWQYLELDSKLPVFETIRTWLMRVGVARMLLKKVETKDGQWVWFVDHSCQIGAEKVLAILGLRLEDLPPPGTPLKHADLMTLLIENGKNWKHEDVAKQYEQLMQQLGAPLAILSDQAAELQGPVSSLKNGKKPVLSLTDPKHKMSNILKSVIGKEKRFANFQKQLGKTRSAIQQTELGHFTPPKQKTKSRFMNLQSTVNWASMVQWQLSNPNSKARKEISAERFNDKLAWLRDYRPDIQRWDRCLKVVSVTLTMVNEEGLSCGFTNRLKKELDKLPTCEASKKVIKQTLAFMRESEQKLKSLKTDGLRVPMSTEVLESVFGRYKQLEGQHSQGGFTSLLASFATLLRPTTADEITESFAAVSTQDMRKWVKEKLEKTTQSKKNIAYAEYKRDTQTKQENTG